MQRQSIDDPSPPAPPVLAPAASYFLEPNVTFFSSGCTVLDCVLGGGWAKRRNANIVGDKSTGKTLLAIEACANYVHKFPKDLCRYAEAEAAFDKGYAKALGMPIERIDWNEDKQLITVEEFGKDVEKFADSCTKKKVGGLYVLDSLDALSDAAEMDRELDDKSYGANKAKKMSEFFRTLNGKISGADITLLIISQVREKIGVAFGKHTTRSGGRSLDFFASQVLELAHKGRIKMEREKVERVIGVDIAASLEKSKIGLPFRKAEFEILFGFGIEDVNSSLNWLKTTKFEGTIPGFGTVEEAEKKVPKLTDAEYHQLRKALKPVVRSYWIEVENRFLPTRTKYGTGNND